MADLHFELVTPEKLAVRTMCSWWLCPALKVILAFSADHAPVMSTIRSALSIYA